MSKAGSVKNLERKDEGRASRKAAIVEEWMGSGKTAAEFAKSQGINRSSLFAWKKRMTDAERVEGLRGFRPVRLPGGASEDGKVVVRGQGGLSVVVDAGSDEAALVLALRSISRCG